MAGVELLGLLQAVLGADADDVDLIAMLASELLDLRGFPVADGSVRRPEPEQDRAVRRRDLRERERRPGADVGDLGGGEREARRSLGDLDRGRSGRSPQCPQCPQFPSSPIRRP